MALPNLFESALPFSEEAFCGTTVLVQGIELGCVKVPRHTIYLESDLVTGFVEVQSRPKVLCMSGQK